PLDVPAGGHVRGRLQSPGARIRVYLAHGAVRARAVGHGERVGAARRAGELLVEDGELDRPARGAVAADGDDERPRVGEAEHQLRALRARLGDAVRPRVDD